MPAGRPGTLGAVVSTAADTVIDNDAWLFALALFAASIASTV